LFWWSQKWMASWLTSFDPEQLGVEPHFLSCKSGFDIWFYRHTIHQKQVFDHEEFDLAQNIWFALLQPSFTTHHKSRLRYQKQQKPDPWSAGLNMIRNWATSLYINLCYIITWEKTTHTHIYNFIYHCNLPWPWKLRNRPRPLQGQHFKYFVLILSGFCHALLMDRLGHLWGRGLSQSLCFIKFHQSIPRDTVWYGMQSSQKGTGNCKRCPFLYEHICKPSNRQLF
jgi:hypothetical protein